VSLICALFVMFYIAVLVMLSISLMTACILLAVSKGVSMIQFYVNSRPVPRAIARHHLAQGNPSRTTAELSRILSKAIAKDAEAVRFLSAYGVEVHEVQL
jgi:HAMP domain-containing protein